jgi:hypothetical protein
MARLGIIILSIVFFTNVGFSQFKTDTTKRVNFAAIPIFNYSPSFGFSAGAMVSSFYKLNPKDTISPTSSTGVFGVYTTNKTYFAAAFQKFYIREDKWRVTLAAGVGNLNFQYWQELPIIGGQFINFNSEATFAMAMVERKIYKKLYGGLHGSYINAKTEFDVPDFFPDTLRFDERMMNNLGFLFNFDMREHQVNPYKGYNVSTKFSYYRKWMNSGNDFNKYEIIYNHYYKIKNERNIIATRLKATISGGDVPFQGQNVVGGDDIRGYSAGKFRNNQIYTIQAEYRWRFYKKLGMVGFFGLASAVDKIGDITTSELLPGVGVGMRYLVIPKERINIGIDIAKGKGDWGLYFRIGESFGR